MTLEKRSFLSGMITVEFTSASPEKTIDMVTLAKIPISHIQQKTELTYQIRILRKDYLQLTEILQRQGAYHIIIGKSGPYWYCNRLLKRPFLLGTFLVLMMLSCFLPSRILFITVEGNESISDQMILNAAENCGIRFGSSRKRIRSEQVKNALLSAVPQIQWAGVNTSGCTAVISVRERNEGPGINSSVPSNLVADHDGYILSAVITSGTPQVIPGQSVTKGQTLVSGYTDCGICIRVTRAEGEILAQTNRKLTAVMPAKYDRPQLCHGKKYKISLLVRKKRINLWKDSRISDITCGRMYSEYYVSLPGGFRLPIAVCIDQYLDYEVQEVCVPEKEAQLHLQNFSEDYLVKQMISGKIIGKKQQLSGSEGMYRLESSFTCTEIIGKEQREQIGVINGERN